MRKVQVFLREDQKTALASIACRTGRKQSDLIRRGVDLLIERAENDDRDWRAAIRASAGIWRGRTDLEALSRDFRAAAGRRIAPASDPG